MKTLSIAKSFTDAPGGRYRTDGPMSGQEFREDVLIPLFEESEEDLVIDLDECFGFATSFLEEAFGGLARKYGSERVISRLSFICHDEPEIIEEIKSYIKNANK